MRTPRSMKRHAPFRSSRAPIDQAGPIAHLRRSPALSAGECVFQPVTRVSLR